MADTADLLRRAKAGDRDALNDALTAFTPWARRRAMRAGSLPWRDGDAAFSAALDSLWKAILILPDGYDTPTGPAEVIYRRRQCDEIARRRAACRIPADRLGPMPELHDPADRRPGPADEAEANEARVMAADRLFRFRSDSGRLRGLKAGTNVPCLACGTAGGYAGRPSGRATRTGGLCKACESARRRRAKGGD